MEQFLDLTFTLNFYSCMFSQDVTPLPRSMEQANLMYLKKPLSSKHLQEAALVFTTVANWMKRKNQLGKKAMSIIFKGDTDHSLKFLHHKQLVWKVTTANLCQTGNATSVKSNEFVPVLTDLETGTQYILKIRCLCKTDCSSGPCGS